MTGEDPLKREKKALGEENFDNERYLYIFEAVFEIVKKIETRKEDKKARVQGILKHLKNQKDEEEEWERTKERLMITQKCKSFMCPLGTGCPTTTRPRWPDSNRNAVTQIGKSCPFAHHPFEITFSREILARRRAMKAQLKMLQEAAQEENSVKRKAFLPAGPFDASKTLASVLDKFRTQHKKKVLSRPKKVTNKLVEINKHKQDSEERTTKKLGFYRRAQVLMAKGRLSDAFEMISQGAQLVKEDKLKEEQEDKELKSKWKSTLGLDDDFQVDLAALKSHGHTAGVDLNTSISSGTSLGTAGDATHQKTLMYAQKTGMLAPKIPDVNYHLNKQIELLYQDIDNILKSKQNDIHMMRKKVEELEENATTVGFAHEKGSNTERSLGSTTTRPKIQKTKMCPNLRDFGKCEDRQYCKYAHTAIELDLVPNERKIANLQKLIDHETETLRTIKPVDPWRPAKSKTVDRDNFKPQEFTKLYETVEPSFLTTIDDVTRYPIEK
eukprot:CAMPEP_0115031850 /NCGR_PEP_ID=MMETSP0216-20121206/38800_1 /TAXON_ID=223996 /ORGANISM="Protocruzia adherens, Strain Boccale" /LENGTH=497 /DNA_ID=CAMNT_0002409621 /DNA_START=19 /DNA_END=1512 /DNA_ORIENTATION=-